MTLLEPKKKKSPTCCKSEIFDPRPQLDIKFWNPLKKKERNLCPPPTPENELTPHQNSNFMPPTPHKKINFLTPTPNLTFKILFKM